jgi:hypothetical protein
VFGKVLDDEKIHGVDIFCSVVKSQRASLNTRKTKDYMPDFIFFPSAAL